MSFKLLGVGSPLVDYSVDVSENFIAEKVSGGKGGTRNISAEEKDSEARGEDEARRARAVKEDSAEEKEMRESLLSLFDDDDSDDKCSKKHKKRG